MILEFPPSARCFAENVQLLDPKGNTKIPNEGLNCFDSSCRPLGIISSENIGNLGPLQIVMS